MTMQELRELNNQMDAIEARIADLENNCHNTETRNMTLDGYRRELQRLGETVVN